MEFNLKNLPTIFLGDYEFRERKPPYFNKNKWNCELFSMPHDDFIVLSYDSDENVVDISNFKKGMKDHSGYQKFANVEKDAKEYFRKNIFK